MPFDRTVFFDSVRPMFGNKLSQSQVDGMNAVLDAWDAWAEPDADLRHLAYPLATDKWETSSTMQPIEEYGKGKGMAYGTPDPTTGQTYYGRGYVQLTWRDNYAKADKELELKDEESCEWHAENALNPIIAAEIMFQGMAEGWFRKGKDGGPETLTRYFNEAVDDPYNARDIINGDKAYKKEWANNESVGNLIAKDHRAFLTALELSFVEEEVPVPAPDELVVFINVKAPSGVRVELVLEGEA
jgi:hypothetical protein